ncbi:MAG: TIGR01620 family protein [Pseudomonadota bacterium]
MSKGPVLINLEDTEAPSPAEAPPVPDPVAPAAHEGRAMQTVATLAARKPSRLARLFWGLLLALLGAVVSVAAWDFITGLIARNVVLGYGVTALIVAFGLVCLVVVLRELAAFSRLARIDKLHRDADEALAASDLTQARNVVANLNGLYAGRDDTRWGRDRLKEYGPEQLDAAGLLGLAEAEILAPLDIAAAREIEAAARQVATVTAIVPLAFADVIAALTANLRMIRRIAEVYGGRSGTLGSWRLARAVMTHLVATGAVAVGDDLLGSVAGGSVLSKVSRRFGEGIVNGALTARVGVAAMEVCRPLPFKSAKRPSVTRLVQRALTGLFGQR